MLVEVYCMKIFVSFLLLLITIVSVKGQSFAINTDGSTASASALLDVKSATKGILIPRLSKTEKNSIAAPATGLLVFQNAPDSIGFQYYDGSKWIWILGSNNVDTLAWKTNGNIGTNTTNHFIGTRDNVPLSFRQNNKWLGRLNSTSKNYFIGAEAGINNSSTNNIAIGDSALIANSIGTSNIGIGSNALKTNISSKVIGIGTGALRNNNAPFGTVAIGDSAGHSTFGSEGIYMGYKAARSVATSDGYRAVVIGAYAGDSSVANWSTIIGALAGRKNTSQGNTFIGSAAGENNTTGYNCFIGDNSGTKNITGTGNTFVGNKSGINNNGINNIALGEYALSANTLGRDNTAIGNFSLDNNIGDFNTVVGTNAGGGITTGLRNTLLGSYADVSFSFITNATAIGSNARVDQSNSMVLGSINGINGALSNTNVGIGTTAPTTTLDVQGGIRTAYSGSVVITCSAGLNIYTLSVSPAVPAGWNFTNTMVIVSVVDGTTGTIYQTKLINTSQISVDMNNNFGGATRFNYIIFKL